jgi:predicted permease
MTGWSQDIRYALRQFTKAPGLTAVLLITLALGIGANTALFSIVNGVLLNPLPYPHPEQLVALRESKANFEFGTIPYLNFRDWQKDNHTFSTMAVWRSSAFSLTGVGDAEQVGGEFISSDFFTMLGAKPVVGRNLLRGEDEIGAPPLALISEGLWRRKFGSAPDIVNKSITLDGKTYSVIGVIPSSFHFWSESPAREVFIPIGQWTNNLLASRGAGLGINGIGRLKPGITIEQARADMASVTSNLAAAFPEANKGTGAKLIPLKNWLVGGIERILLILQVSVAFVLLIACVNVANLLLARSSARTREFAVRSALGATQRRVVRQLLTESLVLAFAGGALGLLLAAWGTRAVLGVLPTALPRAQEIGLDVRVLIFTLGVSVFAGILFGLVPALKMSSAHPQEGLKEGGRTLSSTRHTVQGAFVITEMAMALVLLAGSGLMVRSLVRLWSVDPGFDPNNALYLGMSLPPSMMNATPDAVRTAYRELDRRISAISGVESVSQTWGALPLSGDDEFTFWFEGQPEPASQSEKHWALDYIVEPAYLKAMGLRLLQGRFLTEQDNERTPRVVVVDDVFARKLFPNGDAIGKRIESRLIGQPAEIVGVVAHVKQWGLDTDQSQSVRMQVYMPCMQMPDAFVQLQSSGSGMIVRSSQASAGLLDSIREVSRQMSSEQVIFAVQSMEEIVAESIADRRFSMILLAAFAGLALLLAGVGIYGVISYVVGQRTHEIGIRMALGARQPDILRLVLSGAGGLAVIGIGIGLASALALTRLMANLLYGVGPNDPITFVVVPLILGSIALLASYLPARRASRVDPMVALRYE